MKILKSILIASIFFITANSVNAQDAKAKGILDRLSKKTETYKSMSADFDYTMINKSDDINETQSGSLKTKGEKYNLNIAGQNIISDGKTVWTVIEDAEEVQVNMVPEEEEESEDYINPVNILTLWEKGFKYKYNSKSELNGISVDVIDLFPEKADDQSYHTIKLFINQSKMVIEQIIIKGKDGTDFIYRIKSFKADQELAANLFTFKAADYPDFDIIDLR